MPGDKTCAAENDVPCRPPNNKTEESPMTTARLYQLPVDITEWDFDGKTQIKFNWEYEDGSDRKSVV